MSGAPASATAPTPVENSGRDVIVATKISPRNALSSRVFCAMTSTATIRTQPAPATTTVQITKTIAVVIVKSSIPRRDLELVPEKTALANQCVNPHQYVQHRFGSEVFK